MVKNTFIYSRHAATWSSPRGGAVGHSKENVFQLHITWSFKVILPFRFETILSWFLSSCALLRRFLSFFVFWFASTSLCSLGLMTAPPCLCRRSSLIPSLPFPPGLSLPSPLHVVCLCVCIVVSMSVHVSALPHSSWSHMHQRDVEGCHAGHMPLAETAFSYLKGKPFLSFALMLINQITSW